MKDYNLDTSYQAPSEIEAIIAKGTALTRVDVECLNCSAIDNLRAASFSNQSANDADAPYGFCGHKIQASLSFAGTAFTSIISFITNLFLTIISAPFALISDTAADYCYIKAHHMLFSDVAIVAGLVGTLSPDTGEAILRGLVREFVNDRTRCDVLSQLDQEINQSVDGFSSELLYTMGLPKQEGFAY